ncbi:Synaptotagmin-like protein 1 [Tupaia chinensis]|uniref:Synaptotagmin-like protein 1 n=1 Tax=Tupaia chinensis TaxID=246437 RepID=L9K9B4_TUPCH|nr:Synaptotagmin-like protein 1 [Tupaia chinensis]
MDRSCELVVCPVVLNQGKEDQAFASAPGRELQPELMPQGAAHLERTWGLLAFPMAQGPEPEADTPLDLSFLTEEEQEAIANVLQRDAHLRQLEEGRVSKLRASLVDPGQLKVLTGDWFQEARAQRHPRAGVGSDLVRASMRKKKSSRGTGLPFTLYHPDSSRSGGGGPGPGRAACPQYPVPQAALRSRVLSLSVWHRESLGRNVFLGEVRVPLDTWGWDAEPTWLPLQPRVPPSPDGLPSRGLLSLSVKYVPAGSEGAGRPPSGELHFWVKEARELVPLRSGALDSYVQCSVLPDDSQAGRQRTRVVRRSLSPAFNHTMVYDGFGPTDLHQACAELSLWDQGPLASRQLGATRLSLGTGSSYGLLVPWMDSTPEEAQLWRTLLQRPCEWVDGLLPLRTNLVPRTQP